MNSNTSAKQESWYFEFLASLGFTKHPGGVKATRDLAELCHIDEGKYVLNVGCGAGIAICYVAKTYGCRVVGVDILEKMVAQASERAIRWGVKDKIEFKVADAQDLPCEDALFDAVICESVNTFVDDKQKAMSEYVRVTKTGGYVGLNEAIWLKPPPAKTVEYFTQIAGKEVLTSDVWEALVRGSELKDIVVRTYDASPRGDAVNQIKLTGFKEYLRVLRRFLSLCFREPAYRRFMKEALSMPKELIKYMGYGIYVGRK